jgi:hypothetical protein
MPQTPILYAAVTDHGYGHATRLASVLALVQARRPDIRLIGKPGFSTYAEALRQGLVIHGLPRPGFIEAGVLLDGVRDHAFHEMLTREEFFEGDWSFLRRDPCPPRLGPLPQEDGCVQLAEDILSFFAEEAR